MKVIKRNGSKVDFDKNKIIKAINKAFIEVDGKLYENETAMDIADDIEKIARSVDSLSIEEIQNLVETYLMDSERTDVARAYIRYRYKREQDRATNNDLENRYQRLHKLITGQDEESNKENSNKDTRIIPTMRDYIAGFTCRELAEKVILPKDIVEAHEAGIIHYHDTDYSPVMPMPNCCLINLEDMLQNGTVISGTMIEKPHSFSTACNITTQIIAQVASNQYGGQTFSLAHLAPFVDISRQKIRKKVIEELKDTHNANDTYLIDKITESRLHEEVTRGVQMIQYQILTLLTTNGLYKEIGRCKIA